MGLSSKLEPYISKFFLYGSDLENIKHTYTSSYNKTTNHCFLELRPGNMASALMQRNIMKTRASQSLFILFRFLEMYFLFLLSQFDEALPL